MILWSPQLPFQKGTKNSLNKKSFAKLTLFASNETSTVFENDSKKYHFLSEINIIKKKCFSSIKMKLLKFSYNFAHMRPFL